MVGSDLLELVADTLQASTHQVNKHKKVHLRMIDNYGLSAKAGAPKTLLQFAVYENNALIISMISRAQWHLSTESLPYIL